MNDDNELITWTSKLSCGIKIIDDQHRGLVNFVNEMYQHITGNYVQEREYFSRVIQEMIAYAKNHFATEEKILRTTRFSDYIEHKRAHENFVFAIIENIRDFESGNRFTLSNFTRFFKGWVLSHIALMDKQYFVYIRKTAIRKDDGKLGITMNDISKII